ncbi:adhesion G-protein coupled receptor D2 [Pangasianodon hypophthalmus]|uniref:adhesion G-protein coupled receptor D2 n=1 Tax=Pangasianodon hypophthalmus TaxID=310915 RepID=UPI002307A87C|nr:adhesion G-protein coupled receptor D2 [Pangasianodon hypophthalmus]XP_026768770.3 adhesion G-protein coupled receptor D2 [Pangasianodon hypophthalmus]
MHLLKLLCSNVIVLIQHCIGKALAIDVEIKRLWPNGEVYYEYHPARLHWHAVNQLCIQRSGSLAVIRSAGEKQNLTKFLQSLNISESVWIAKRAPEIKETLILKFQDRSELQSTRLLHKFSDMTAVTVCAHLQFNPTCHGPSAVFSYSIRSFIKEFQLRARVLPNEPIQLALLVHGKHGPYLSVFANDASWHSVCVSWTGNGGKWAISVDGQEVRRGISLYSTGYIRGGGIFIIGQEQDSFGSSFKSDEAFCGSITQLHIWDQVLDASKIQTMEKECSVIPSDLLFRWGRSGLEMTPSLQTDWGYIQCQEHSQMAKNEKCVSFHAGSGEWAWDNCDTQRGGVCQFDKELLDDFGMSNFPKTPFFTQISKNLHAKPELEDHNSSSSTEHELNWLSSLAQSVVKAIETDPDIITPSDMLHLTQTIEQAAASQVNKTSLPSGVLRSMASSYLILASGLIDPVLARQWLDMKPLGINLRPFMVVELIEKILWALADSIFTDKKSFALLTKNIDVHMEPRTLSQVNCKSVYKPSKHGNQSINQEDILISETEVQRLYSLGHKNVMFIHTYYSHMMEVLSRAEFKAFTDKHTESGQSVLGHLATAVISATVRDVLREENVPVSVQYTLSTVKVVESSKLVTPLCIFWNVSAVAPNVSDWSDKGCSVLYSGPNSTSCFCNHTTNFAILMNYLEARWSEEEEMVLTKLTFIGSGASLCALVVTLMLLTVLDIPKSERTSIHKNLFISLTFAQIVLLCSGSAIHNKVACTMVAALLHLFFMAAFSWMLVEGLLLWSKVVTVNLSEDRHMKYYYLIGWGLPVLIVSITLASASGNYAADEYCWLSVHNGVIWGFVGPVIFIITVNIMVLTRVIIITISTAKRRSLMMADSASPIEQASEQIRAAVKAVLVLLPILGLTWLCGVLVPFSIIIAYIFILLNSLQGLFIFLIYGVYNTEIRSTVNRIKERRKAQNFSNCGSSRPSSSITNSQPGSSPVPDALGRHDFAASQPGSLSTSSDCGSLSYSIGRHFSIPCVHDSLKEDLSCLSSGTHMTTQDNRVQSVEGKADSCSLHVPMGTEVHSCYALHSSPEQHSSGF